MGYETGVFALAVGAKILFLPKVPWIAIIWLKKIVAEDVAQRDTPIKF